MRAGALDRRIRLEQAISSQATDGESALEWVPMPVGNDGSVAAERRPLRGNELFTASQLAAKVDVEFRIRYPHVSISPSDKVRLLDLGDVISIDGAAQPRIYDITHVAEIGRREGLSIYATARAESNAGARV